MSRYQRYLAIRKTATRILYAKDPQPNRSAAYAMAWSKADIIALRCARRVPVLSLLDQ